MYHPHSLKLEDGQKAKLAKTFSSNEGVALSLKHENLHGSFELFLTKTQIRCGKVLRREREWISRYPRLKYER